MQDFGFSGLLVDGQEGQEVQVSTIEASIAAVQDSTTTGNMAEAIANTARAEVAVATAANTAANI